MIPSSLGETDTNSDLTKSLRPGAEAEKRGEYIVQFVRKDSSDTPILAGSKVGRLLLQVLRTMAMRCAALETSEHSSVLGG